MPSIQFTEKPIQIGTAKIILLPKTVSAKLPSRGMVMVDGIINKLHLKIPLEPDGKGSHWFKIDKTISKAAGSDNSITLTIEATKEWPEPKIPNDLQEALNTDTKANEIWLDITPTARWDWIRWINATKNPDTRKIRIYKTCSKLKSGTRSACCFNRSQCTDTSVSKNGVLL